MTYRLADDVVTLSHGSGSVRLRPSLRAVSILEHTHGFDRLFRGLEEYDHSIISDVILTTATDQDDAKAFVKAWDGKPLSAFFGEVMPALVGVLRAFIPASEGDDPATGEQMPWQDVYRELYRTATGWIGWTPQQALDATPAQINEAFAGRLSMLKAVHGSADEKTESKADAGQAARNIAEGLDPEFDRAGLRALKAKLAGGR